jgi:hypothetical protein
MTPFEPVPSFQTLIEWLTIATSRQELKWEVTADQEDFRAPLDDGYVWLARFPEVPPGSFSQDAVPGRYTITFMAADGQPLERAYAVSPGEVLLASQLHSRVRRWITRMEPAFARMLRDLKKKANQSA